MTELRRRVPVRTILATIGLVLATGLLVKLVMSAERVLTWIVVAAFFAVAMNPAVNWVEQRVTRGRRMLATLLVYLLVVCITGGLVALFAAPLVSEGAALAERIPGFVEDVRSGEGPVGEAIVRFGLQGYLDGSSDFVTQHLAELSTPALALASYTANLVVGAVTVLVLSYLMVLQAPRIVRGTLSLVPPERAAHLERLGGECSRTVNGYLFGNVLISVICGGLAYGMLSIMDVPFAALLALFVAITDLIPLVGATLGAIAGTAAAFTVSVRAGVVLLVFFVVYQQLENHLLQPLILSKTVQLSPLVVLLVVLLAVELSGILGAFLAIPVAGVLQVVLRDALAARRRRVGVSTDEAQPEEPELPESPAGQA